MDATNGISYAERIAALRETKSDHTAEKQRTRGFFDIDDHGCIPWPDPIPFTPMPSHPDGGVYGPRACGANLRAWLEVHPAFIHPHSALAGAWTAPPPGVGGLRPEDRADHLVERQRKYNIIQPGIGAMNHSGPDMRIGFELGWGGLLDRIRKYRTLNNPADTSFYDAEEDVVLGMQQWIGRHVDRAREMAAREPNPGIRDNLRQVADMNQWLITNPPRTLREACQFLAWFQSVDRMWFYGGALGQLDELLRPYYEADRADRWLTDEEAIWIIASLLFNDTHYSQVAGPAPDDGRDLASPVSFLVLEAVHRLRIPSNIAVRVHDGIDRRLLRTAVTNLLEDQTGVCYACSNGLDAGYMRNGVPRGIARMRAKVGCNWTALPGIEYCLQDICRVCLVKPFTLALDELIADRRDAAPCAADMDDLWRRYTDHLREAVATLKEGLDWHMAHQAANTPELVLNLFAHGPIERGLDMSAGGVDLYFLTTDGVGLATVADSFGAVSRRVVAEGRIGWQRLGEILAADFAGADVEQRLLRTAPRYGAGGTAADDWARRIGQAFSDLVRGTPTPAGFTVLPGLFSHGVVAQLGAALPATPNGRHSGAPISHSADPDPGFMPDGGAAPTAKAIAVAEVQPRWGNTTPLQLDIDVLLAQSAGGIEAVEALILGHNAMGGTLININVISREDILRAHEDPSLFPDLVVRVTGYSAYFRTLSREYRQQVVDRVLAGR